jgi:hypothetical protein
MEVPEADSPSQILPVLGHTDADPVQGRGQELRVDVEADGDQAGVAPKSILSLAFSAHLNCNQDVPKMKFLMLVPSLDSILPSGTGVTGLGHFSQTFE